MVPARLNETSSQTAGPYVHIGLTPHRVGIHVYEKALGEGPAPADTPGERIRIEGRIIDGAGAAIRDGVVELWQVPASGQPAHGSDIRRWARSITDLTTGLFSFDTVKPGHIDGSAAAPHASLWIVARGINIGLHTRVYFSDEAVANTADPILNLVDPPSRRDTLIARRSDRPGSVPVYTFDIHLQGDRETVFFDL